MTLLWQTFVSRLSLLFGIRGALCPLPVSIQKRLCLLLTLTLTLSSFQSLLFHTAMAETAKSPAAKASAKVVGLSDALAKPYPAPAIDGIQEWINSKPLVLSKLKGKVVLIDFWTYSCINCIRTLPHMSALYERYKDKGLVIIGVHTPEFEFEKVGPNIQKAIQANNIQYPIAVDSKYTTWNNYKNSFWPAHYLIDQNGKVVFEHFGEGEYDKMENNIRALLAIGPEKSPKKASKEPSFLQGQTPETYLGFARTQHFASPEGVNPNRDAQYSFPKTLRRHQWALQGKWRFRNEKLVAESPGASLRMNFYARQVFLVLGPIDGKPVTVKVQVKDEPGSAKTITVDRPTLYTLAQLKAARTAILELETEAPGLEAYAFTFGNDSP